MSDQAIKIERMTKVMQKVERRTAMAHQAMEEMKQVMDEVMQEAKAHSYNVRLNKTEQADLLGISRSHLYKIGITDCTTYGDLFVAVKDRRPDLLPALEENFKTYLKTT